MVTKIQEIKMNAGNKNEFFLIHGFSGSPTDFGDLPRQLSKKFKASVFCPIMPGHCTNVEDLNLYDSQDYINFIENKLKDRLNKKKRIILVGTSYGAQLALYLSSKYSVSGVVLCSLTHNLRFPFNLPFIQVLGRFKKKWNKHYHPNEIELRKNAFSYKEMPSCALRVSKNTKKEYTPHLKNISCPVFSIYSTQEKIGHPSSTGAVFDKISSDIKEEMTTTSDNHNLFYSPHRHEVINGIINFIENEGLFYQRKSKEKASAIIPAYNEGKRIGRVLSALVKSKTINEIIVVDDGSRDNTAEVVAKYPQVKCLKNEVNIGKGGSMDRGVKAAKNDIIFFCDADLIGFEPRHADKIISPILNNHFDMYIGVRGNFMQRSITLFGLNSGERALRKYLWMKLPNYYKYRYRIEAGLNFFVKRYGKKGFGWEVLNYSQPIKESKYGPIKGTALRWWMNMDVLASYISYVYMNRVVKLIKG